MSTRIAVVGAGIIGKTLTRRLTLAGVTVQIGVREPASTAARALRAELPDAAVAPIGSAIEASDVVVVAIPGASLEAFVVKHAAAIGSRVVLDATNHLGGETLHGLTHWQRHAPDARVVRAFCSSGWETFADPSFHGVQADLFYCGPDGEAQTVAERVITAVGLRPVRLGGEESADLLDGIAKLWFQLAFREGRGRDIAFKLLER